MVPFLSQHAMLSCLPRRGAELLVPHLSLVELRRGELPCEHAGRSQVWFPLTCTVAVETVMTAGGSLFQLFLKGSGVCTLRENQTSGFHARFTVVDTGFALVGCKSDVWTTLQKLMVQDLFFYGSLIWLSETYGVNGICAASHGNPQRLAGLLLQASLVFDKVRGIALSHQQLATYLGIRRETVGELVLRWAEAGILQTGRARVEIIDHERLETLACDCWRAVLQSVVRAKNHWAEGVAERHHTPPPLKSLAHSIVRQRSDIR